MPFDGRKAFEQLGAGPQRGDLDRAAVLAFKIGTAFFVDVDIFEIDLVGEHPLHQKLANRRALFVGDSVVENQWSPRGEIKKNSGTSISKVRPSSVRIW